MEPTESLHSIDAFDGSDDSEIQIQDSELERRVVTLHNVDLGDAALRKELEQAQKEKEETSVLIESLKATLENQIRKQSQRSSELLHLEKQKREMQRVCANLSQVIKEQGDQIQNLQKVNHKMACKVEEMDKENKAINSRFHQMLQKTLSASIDSHDSLSPDASKVLCSQCLQKIEHNDIKAFTRPSLPRSQSLP